VNPSREPLYSPRVVRALLERHGLKPTRSLGQNFLVDGNVLERIVEAGGARSGRVVYEVGPGLGVLTRALAQTGASVTAVEKDERLRPVLEETLSGLDNVRLVFGDALDYHWEEIPHGSLLVANLPYYVSTAILTRLLESGRFERLTVLVQREVADRITAPVGSDAYGFLSAVTALYGRAEKVRDVPKGAFWPPPDVTSSVVRITPEPGRSPAEGVMKVLEAALHHRRKTIRNNLLLAGYPPEKVVPALEQAGIAPETRGETVPLEALERLAQALDRPEA
jgi:16S rRNA (adenine1518-N6/adenine1519-N6)-dimethyltransferase